MFINSVGAKFFKSVFHKLKYIMRLCEFCTECITNNSIKLYKLDGTVLVI